MVKATYQGSRIYFVRDDKNVYAEVRTEAEANAIVILEKASETQAEAVEQLAYIRDYVNSKID